MSSEANMTADEAPSSMPAIKPSYPSRPRFDGSETPSTNEVGFKKVSAEKPEPAAPEQLPLLPTLPPPPPPWIPPAEDAQAATVESTALVPVPAEDQSAVRVKILPHIEVDYSKYQPVNYHRIDPNINLRSVQEEAVDTYLTETTQRRVIIQLPTGCGKTVAGLTIAGRINGRVLWIAHRDELIEQPADELRRLFPGLEFGIEKANKRDGVGKRVVISSIQTLSRKNRILPLLQGAPFSVVIYDECHHATSAQAMRVLSWLGCFREDGKGPRLLGLTATIERSDKTSLGHVFQDVIYSLSIQEATELGFLVPHKSVKVYLPMRLKRGEDGDVSISDADREAKRLNVAQANATAVAVHCEKRKTIVFTTSVDQAKRTSEACQKLGIKAEWVSGMPYMNKGERKDAIKRFAGGEIQVLTCADLLTEGFDDRSISAVVIARPTMSQSRYVQMAGRGLRTCEHKTNCLLIDIACSDLPLVTADILLKPKEKRIQRKARRRVEIPVDSNTEWQRLQSYLRSARIDTIEHGEITFARCSDNLIVTVAKDTKLVILRSTKQKEEDPDLWVIEHGGIVYTLEPLTLQEAMSVCDTLLPTFGGSVKPDSPEWDKATEGPTPPPGIMPTTPTEATQIVDPAAQLPLAMKAIVSGASDPADLVERVSNDIMNANSATFARGLRLAFKMKRCHLLGIDKGAPADRHKWGWETSTKFELPPMVKDAKGHMIGWIYGDLVCVDPGLAVEIARQALKESGEESEIKTSLLRTHLGTVNRTFKDMRRDWIKVKTKDIEPVDEATP